MLAKKKKNRKMEKILASMKVSAIRMIAMMGRRKVVRMAWIISTQLIIRAELLSKISFSNISSIRRSFRKRRPWWWKRYFLQRWELMKLKRKIWRNRECRITIKVTWHTYGPPTNQTSSPSRFQWEHSFFQQRKVFKRRIKIENWK